MTPAELADAGEGWRTCSGCGTVEDAAGPDQDGEGRSACCTTAPDPDGCYWCTWYPGDGCGPGCLGPCCTEVIP